MGCYGVYSQQKTGGIQPVLPKGYMLVRRGNQVQKTYDMVNFTPLISTTNNFNSAVYNPINNYVYYYHSNGIYRININTGGHINIYANAYSSGVLNIDNQSYIGRDMTTNSLYRINFNIDPHPVTTSSFDWNFYTLNFAAPTTTYYTRSLDGGSPGYTKAIENSTNGTTWTNVFNATGLNANVRFYSSKNDISTGVTKTATGTSNYFVSNDGGITRTTLSNTIIYQYIIIFDENEYMIGGVSTRVPFVSTNGSSWSSYTLPPTGTYSVTQGVKSNDGIYLITTQDGRIFRKQGDFTTATGWTEITNPFGTTNIRTVNFTDRFIISTNTAGTAANTIATSLDGINWTLVSPTLNLAMTNNSCFIPE